ncbi:hypothetical protein AGOR_G00102570 [Albula goreensis]|uniref:Uncharacterized protein n=1 Tax=Albula goreensis TaxID=1534307 RepID=A0A8T3DJ63_9TELE|nr:hypothetical protein AGOR_G00102570 [Albula goreensis]
MVRKTHGSTSLRAKTTEEEGGREGGGGGVGKPSDKGGGGRLASSSSHCESCLWASGAASHQSTEEF